MGRLTPQEIRELEFKQGALGFNKEQVNQFLDVLEHVWISILDTLLVGYTLYQKVHVEDQCALLWLTK